MSIPLSHDSGLSDDQPIRLEPIRDSTPSPAPLQNNVDWVEPTREPLLLAPEVPPTPDPILEDLEQFRVPNSTQYRCANCNYILAGLTSRRCPECGEPFSLDAAQMHGREPSVEMHQLETAMRRDTIKFYAGVALLVAAFVMPNIAGGAGRAGLISARGMVMIMILFPALVFTAYFRLSGDFKWCNLILLVGVLAAIFGVVLTIF